jgi:hypothetical protein
LGQPSDQTAPATSGSLRRNRGWIVDAAWAPEVVVLVNDGVRPVEVEFGREESILHQDALTADLQIEVQPPSQPAGESLPIREFVDGGLGDLLAT